MTCHVRGVSRQPLTPIRLLQKIVVVVEFKELHTYYPDSLKLPVFCPLKKWMADAVWLKIGGVGGRGAQLPGRVRTNVVSGCIIDECYGGLFLII